MIATHPFVATHPFLDQVGPVAFAHRGGTETGPENTLRAFRDAVELGYRYLETDVHATADGILVAFHDDRLDRVTDRTGLIARMPWADVRAARVGGAEPILRLDALLEALPDARINIDPKDDAAVDPLIRILGQSHVLDRVCIGSFSDRRLGAVRAAFGPAVCTSLGTMEVAALRASAWGAPGLASLLVRRPGRCVQVPATVGGISLVSGRLMEVSHQLGMKVHVWTVNTEAEMDRLLDLGVDGLMTDHPRRLRDVLVRRGAWRTERA